MHQLDFEIGDAQGRTHHDYPNRGTIVLGILVSCLHLFLAHWALFTTPTFGVVWQRVTLLGTFFWVPPSLVVAAFSARAAGFLLILGIMVITLLTFADAFFTLGLAFRQGNFSELSVLVPMFIFLLVMTGPMAVLSYRLLRRDG